MLMKGSRGLVKVMDFGLAQLAGGSKFTREGTTLGTMSYMSPEQAAGAETDSRADIWSLGVVLYEMVAGQPPFRGDYDQVVVYSIINEPPEPLTAVRTGVPKELERIVNKCLAKAPGERYQRVDELLVDLNGLQKE
jgi:serine/threonine protein kinase